MQGLIFGIVDNGIMIVGAFWGLSLEKILPKKFQVGGLGEGNLELACGTFIGCIIALIFIPIVDKLKRRKIWKLQEQIKI